MQVYTCNEGFSLRQEQLGWQWQETGAQKWSAIYSTRKAAINAIKTEFPCRPVMLWTLPGNRNCS